MIFFFFLAARTTLVWKVEIAFDDNDDDAFNIKPLTLIILFPWFFLVNATLRLSDFSLSLSYLEHEPENILKM